MIFLTICISSEDSVAGMYKDAYLDERSNTLRLMDHQTPMCLHSLSASSCGPHSSRESRISSTSTCSVDSSCHVGISFEQFKGVCGDHSDRYHSHQDVYSLTMCVVLGFALAGQLMQIPAASHSIHNISEWLLHILQMYDLSLSRPCWVWLWLQRDFVKHGIWAAFLCVHHCPFRPTCRIYPHSPQKTSLATTPNNVLGQSEDKIALPLVEEVHLVVHIRSSLVERASLLMHCLSQVRDSLQDSWQTLAKMSLSTIRKSDIARKYWVAIHGTIVRKHGCDPRSLPTLTRNMLAAIHAPSMLQKHPAECTSPPLSSDVLALPQSSRDQLGVHFPMVCRQVVFHWRVLILTTVRSSIALRSESSGVQHPVELLHLQSG